ncbi:PREDICTED: vitellogenin-3-like [Wasmannia auropunctata]|uniref:vitellogenin-3-like n=1 Tax=Wasmannia auropunctata TaxID=64793 RepID=UPI0005ED8A9F|nr:PREDICTED: vitellogenin-3-like [Wasmannia auropunctata]
MWFPVTLLLLVGVAVATTDHSHGWESQTEYQYLVHSRTITGLDKLKNQYSGLQLKGVLTVQVKSPESLVAKLSDPQYARIHTTLPDGPETKISDQMLEYRELPMSGKPFEIKLKHGVIRNLMVDRDVPTWELNILKGFVSQLQVDTQGENVIKRKDTQIPIDENSSSIFNAMEDSVGGNCEVLYEIIPLHSDAILERQDRLPFPHLHGGAQHYDVKKTKNYNNCQQRQLYHVGLHDSLLKEKVNQQDQILSQFSTTQMIITGDLKRFTIQSTETKNQVSVKPDVSDPFIGAVHSLTRLTLARRSKVSNPLSDQLESANFESTGNLLYAYNDPFSGSENRKARHPSISQNSAQVQSSESSSSSQSSSSEEDAMLLDDSLWQSKAPLHLAPNVPLLPYFVGYKGKTIQMSDKVNVVEHAANLISQIAEEVGSSSKITGDTLEKYTILKNLVRTLNLEQYAELEKRVNSLNKEGQYVWSILRDVVTHAGTGPALLTIHNWLKTKQIKGIEAASIISQIPRHVRHPTAEYIQAFFELCLDPVITQQKYVNVSTPLAFAELLGKSYNGQKNYPIHSFGPMTLKTNNEVVNRYIPHFANQLKQGLSENNSQKIQTYIAALGLTDHPNIISIFEPYIEGTEPVTKFQRKFIVTVLTILAEHQPKLVRPIFYKLYLDTNEDHEVRSLAVFGLIKTDPPLNMWQRLAEFTNVDKSEHVNSFVKSTIQSLANLKRPEMQNLANKARSIKHLLTKKNSGWYSKAYYGDIENWFYRGFNLQAIIGDDSAIPTWLFFMVNSIYDRIGQPTVATYEVSNGKQFLNKLYELLQSRQQKGQQASEELSQVSGFEELVQALKIKPEHLNKLEGNVAFSSVYNLLFYPFDGPAIENLSHEVKDFIFKSQKLQSTIINNQEVTVSFPIENGLPFIYTFESPVLMKLNADWQNQGKSRQISEQISGNFDALVAKRVQKRFGFLAPFEHQNYMTGVDHSLQLQVPLEFEVTVGHKGSGLSGLKIRPNILSMQTQVDSSNGFKLLHHSTIPFTTRQDVLDLQPVSLDKNTHLVLTSEKHKTTFEKDPLHIQVESDNKQVERSNVGDNVVQIVHQLMGSSKKNSNYKKLDVSINLGQIEQSGLYFNIGYDKMVLDDNNGHNKHPRALESQRLFSIKYTKPDSENRRKEIMETLSQGVKSGNVHVFDVSYKVPLQKHAQVLTVGIMELNNVNKTHATYVYWNSQSKTEEPEYEVCYVQTMERSPKTPLDFEYTLRSNPEDTLQGVLRYGKSCMEGTKVIVEGKAMRSNELKEAIENSETAKKCWEEIQNGNKVPRACQKATQLGEIKDNIRVVIKGTTDIVRNVINKIVGWLENIMKIRVKENDNNFETNNINVKMNLLPYKLPKVSVQTPQQEITFPYNTETSFEEQRLLTEKVKMLENEIERPLCTLDKNKIVTFDKRVYPVTLGTTEHVLLTTYPILDPDNHKNPIPEESRVAVSVHDTNDGSRSVNVFLGKREIKLVKSGYELKAVVDGQTVDFGSERYYRYLENGDVIFEISLLPDHSIFLYSKKYGIYVAYDGNHVAVWGAHRYRNAVRGLCGNYDSNLDNDFLTPENCLLTKPKEFTSTYALIQENSEGPILENRRRAEQAQCRERSSMRNYQSNIINDREAGRITAEGELPSGQSWGYHPVNRNRANGHRHRDSSRSSQEYSQEQENRNHNRDSGEHNIVYRTRVFEDNSQQHICFTTKPVPTCREGTTPTERKSKKYDLICEERNEESVGLKHRVEKGANPDFSQRKRANKSKTFQVPVSCSGTV